LKTFKKSFWAKPYHTTTIRTSIKLKRQRLVITIKNSSGKTVSPYRIPLASRAVVRAWPGIISAFMKKKLE
jgi:hypothetical protein